MFNLVAAHLGRTEVTVDLILLACLVLAWFRPLAGNALFEPLERLGSRLARRKRAMIVSIAAAAILLRLGLLSLFPVPVPTLHDEFSYLLAADTFVHGRLTNPPHPMWIYFETFHVNQQPTYMSKYPPAQGAFLAVGQLLGHPWIGVLLSATAMCAASLWMMQGWFPPKWALLGGVLLLLRLGIFGYWTNCYWGGTVAALGGALVLGALPRIALPGRTRAPLWRQGVILGLGLSLLANTRPFEGLLLALPVLAILLGWLGSYQSPAIRVTLKQLLLPFSIVMLCGALFIGYYNRRGTGSALLFPYAVNERAYVTTPTFFWEKPRPAMEYRNKQFEEFYNGWSRHNWNDLRVNSAKQAVRHVNYELIRIVHFFFWPELLFALVVLLWFLFERKTIFFIVLVGISVLGELLVPWFSVHYLADLTPALFALLVIGMRRLRLWQFNARPVGIGISRVMMLFAVFLSPLHPYAARLRHAPEGVEYREIFQRRLAEIDGRHLVIVRYGPNHYVHHEWVYNGADIDHAKVVWAREIPGMDIRPLLGYFRERHVWIADADARVPQLSSYSASGSQ